MKINWLCQQHSTAHCEHWNQVLQGIQLAVSQAGKLSYKYKRHGETYIRCYFWTALTHSKKIIKTVPWKWSQVPLQSQCSGDFFFPWSYSNSRETKSSQLQTVLKNPQAYFGKEKKSILILPTLLSNNPTPLVFSLALTSSWRDLSFCRNKHCFPIERDHHHIKRTSSTWFAAESGPGARGSSPDSSKRTQGTWSSFPVLSFRKYGWLQPASLETMPLFPTCRRRRGVGGRGHQCSV